MKSSSRGNRICRARSARKMNAPSRTPTSKGGRRVINRDRLAELGHAFGDLLNRKHDPARGRGPRPSSSWRSTTRQLGGPGPERSPLQETSPIGSTLMAPGQLAGGGRPKPVQCPGDCQETEGHGVHGSRAPAPRSSVCPGNAGLPSRADLGGEAPPAATKHPVDGREIGRVTAPQPFPKGPTPERRCRGGREPPWRRSGRSPRLAR